MLMILTAGNGSAAQTITSITYSRFMKSMKNNENVLYMFTTDTFVHVQHTSTIAFHLPVEILGVCLRDALLVGAKL